MDENNKKNRRQSASDKKMKKERSGKPRKRWGLRILGVIGTLMLVGVLTAAMFVGIFMKYIDTAMRGHVEVDLSEYTQEVSTELYYKDPATDQWVMYQTLFANENRIWIDSENIPENLKNATIAIEDKRFKTHKGVDWKGTLRGIVYTVTGEDVQGGSTITQQLIKNITGNRENSVKRKITEIYRALALEKEGYTKDEILTIYLNTIYLGNQCYGVQTAADMYFDKDASELTLAECASLISITNNPSMYDPLRADWCREENRERQELVLENMLAQELITQAEYDQAMAEEIVFTDGWTCFGNYVETTKEEDEDDVVSTARNSYYTDAVIEDVAQALVEHYGLEDDPADADGYVRTAHEKAVAMVYGKGLKIYTCQNPNYQEMAEEVFENTSYADYTDSYDQPLQAAITLMDPYTGDILAMVGGTGAKQYDRGWNWATEVRQCGSAIKPISTYAPALDDGTITAASSVDDYPFYLEGYGVYPKNSYGTFDGLSTVQDAIKFSSNCAAVKVNQAYGTYASYNFMTENLGFTTLTATDAEQVGNMALGGLHVGVTTEEMAAAFGAFVNDGIYTAPRTFERVEFNDGTLLLENTSESHVAMKETTAYLMREMLETVVASGTGSEADFSGQYTAGKTGTTDANRDRYFVGFTPYYCAAVWCGYKSNEIIDVWGNPSANLWGQVMEKVHEDLDRKDFNRCSGLTEVNVCADSGLLASEACTHDMRGNRARTVTVAADSAPTESCTMHVMVKYCVEGKHLATEFCPLMGKNEAGEPILNLMDIAVLNYQRDLITEDDSPITEEDLEEKKVVKAKDHGYLLQTISKGEMCPVHKEKPVDPNDPNNPDNPNNPGGDPNDPNNPGTGNTDNPGNTDHPGNTDNPGNGEGSGNGGNSGAADGWDDTLKWPFEWGW